MLDFEYSKKVNFGFFEFGIYQFKSHQSSILVYALIIENELFGLKTNLSVSMTYIGTQIWLHPLSQH